MRSTKRGLLSGVAALLTVVIALGALATSGDSAQAATVTVSAGATTNRYTPNTVTVNVGDTVTFTNGGGVHTATAVPATLFDISLLATGATGSKTFAAAGTFYYFCTIHADASVATEAHVTANDAMVGKIIVQAAAATATTAAATATTAAPTATTAAATATVPAATATTVPATSTVPAATATSTTPTATAPAASPTATRTNTPVPPTAVPPTATAPPPSNAPCKLIVADAIVGGNARSITIASSQQARAGYIAIHEASATGAPGPVIGFTALQAAGSTNNNVVVALDRALKAETVFPMLHTEDNGNTTYDGATVDKPTVDASCGNAALGNIVTFPIKVTVNVGAPATGSGLESSNGSSWPLLTIVLGTLVALAVAGAGVAATVRTRD